MGYRKLSARPRHHAQAEGPSRNIKNLPARLEEIAREKGIDSAPIEVWFSDEARIRPEEQDHATLGQTV
jgi:hypothetical protein